MSAISISSSPHCAVHDAAALQDAQAETTDRRARITKDVPVLRLLCTLIGWLGARFAFPARR